MLGVVKNLFSTQTLCDGIIMGLNYMPKKSTTVVTAAILSGAILHLTEPSTVLTQMSVVVISSGLALVSVEKSHQIGSNLWQKRMTELENTAEGTKLDDTDKDILSSLLNGLLENSSIDNHLPVPQSHN